MMMNGGFHLAVVLLAAFLSLSSFSTQVRSETIVVGREDLGWTEGACYRPVKKAMVGDSLVFRFAGHDVYKLLTQQHFTNCDFSDAMMMAGVGESPFEYTITEQDADDGILYFACSVGDHCAGGTQKVQIQIEPYLGQSLEGRSAPIADLLFGLSPEACAEIQNGEGDVGGGGSMVNDSTCSEPELGDDGRYHVSCTSPPATLTPGGVINNLFLLHYPYPRNKRVLVGLRTWEFVQDDPLSEDGAVIPVPINQLYVHHLSGRVVLGQGTEGIRRSEPDAPYPPPYGVLTGDEGDAMIFHIIDLREVDDWLPCIECRCKSPEDGSYLTVGGGDGDLGLSPDGILVQGGVNCCHNCTDLTGPTVDYRMRYNVSWSFVDQPVQELIMLTADISPVVGKRIEFDVPEYTSLRGDLIKVDEPTVQRLVLELPFREMFQHEFFGADYYGPDTVRLFRCVGHLHVAAIGMWLEDVETGEMLCSGVGSYGTDPNQDKGFLNAIHVDSYSEPKVFPADRVVRLVTEYDASEIHTGVMGMLFIFIDGERTVTASDTDLSIDVCMEPTCDTSQLPLIALEEFKTDEVCEDTLENNPACKFGGLCDCDAVINAPESTGCGGVYSSQMGDIDVNSVCAKSCGCPSTICEDILANSPACSFANLCDCEMFVNQSNGGCGGVFESPQGNIVVNDMCPNYCNACPETSAEDLAVEAFAERLEKDLKSKCTYSTYECREALNNAYSCGMEANGSEEFSDVMRRATVTHASRLALKHSKLGSASLHRDNISAASVSSSQVQICQDNNDSIGDLEDDSSSSAAAASLLVLSSTVLIAVLIFSC